MTILTKATVTKLNDDIVTALKAVAKKHGLILETKGGKFDSNGFSPRISFTVISESGEVMTKERVALDSYKAKIAGFSSKDFGKKFTVDGVGSFILEGFRARASRRPLLIRSLKDDKRYTFATTTARGIKIADLLKAA